MNYFHHFNPWTFLVAGGLIGATIRGFQKGEYRMAAFNIFVAIAYVALAGAGGGECPDLLLAMEAFGWLLTVMIVVLWCIPYKTAMYLAQRCNGFLLWTAVVQYLACISEISRHNYYLAVFNAMFVFGDCVLAGVGNVPWQIAKESPCSESPT